jgi:uncharacterized protein
VRDPFVVADVLRRRGFAVPQVRREPDTTEEDLARIVGRDPGLASGPRPRVDAGTSDQTQVRRWLLKPFASGGGHGIGEWQSGARIPRGSYLQEFVDGTPGSVVFVAAGKRAVPLAVSRQLVGEETFGSSGFRYCGSILATSDDAQFERQSALVAAAGDLAQAVAEEFDLVGVNGIDFIARDGLPHLIEMNPRWCSSMELVERAFGGSVFRAHADACSSGHLPAFTLVRAVAGDAPDVSRAHAATATEAVRGDAVFPDASTARAIARSGAVGKAIVFARRAVVVGDTRAWLDDPTISDVPHPGETIHRGRPVCTVFAAGREDADCYDALVRRAAEVYVEIDSWSASGTPPPAR